MMGSVSKRVSRPKKTTGEKKFTPKIFGLKSALESVPDFFFGNHLPSADEKRLVKSDSNNSKLLWLQRSRTVLMVELNSDWWNVVVYVNSFWWNVVV